MPRAANELRDTVARYLSHELSLGDLESWLIPATWEVEDYAVVELVRQIKLPLAEYLAGHRSEEDLRTRLESILVHYVVAMDGEAPELQVATDSVSGVIPTDVVVTFESADIGFQVAYA